MRSLANVAIMPSLAGCWCGTRVFFSLDCLPIAEGVLPSPLCIFRDEIVDQGMFRVVSGVGTASFTEFQLWVLSTFVVLGNRRRISRLDWCYFFLRNLAR